MCITTALSVLFLCSCNRKPENTTGNAVQVDSSATVDITTESVQEIPENAQFVTFENGDTLWYALSEMTEGEFEEAHQQYNDKIERDTAAHPKTNGRLELKTTAGQPFVTQDVGQTDGDAYEHYEYVGFLPPVNQYVLIMTLYEDGAFLLIDRKTGQKRRLGDTPLLSPRNTWLATFDFGGYQTDPPYVMNLSVYKIAKGDLGEPMLLEFEIPGYCNFNTNCWKNDHTLALKMELGRENVYRRLRLY